MTQQATSDLQIFLMVDLLGRIVFVDDKQAMSYLSLRDSNGIIGEPFFEVFNISFKSYSDLMQQITADNQVTIGTISVLDHENTKIESQFKAVAQLDHNNAIIGYDIALKLQYQLLADTPSVAVNEEPTINVDYEFTQKLIGDLYQLLHKFGGTYLSNHIAKMIKNIAELNDWGISFNEGALACTSGVTIKTLDVIITRGILFSIKAVGKTMTYNCVNKTRERFELTGLKRSSELDMNLYFEK